MRNGNVRVSARTGLLFGPNQNFLFLSNQQLLNFQSSFSFSETNCWYSLASFLVIISGNISLDHGRGLSAIGPFKGNIPCRNINKVISLSFQKIKFRMLWNEMFIIAKAAGKSIASNNS